MKMTKAIYCVFHVYEYFISFKRKTFKLHFGNQFHYKEQAINLKLDLA